MNREFRKNIPELFGFLRLISEIQIEMLVLTFTCSVE